jgi:tetratricopeptide (TPR) repeat protein
LLLLTIFSATSCADTNLLLQGISEFGNGSLEWRLPVLSNAAALLRRASAAEPRSRAAYYWHGTAQFHVALYWLGDKSAGSRDSARRAMVDAAASLERAIELDEGDAESHALLSTIYGMRIADNPASILWRGPLVMRHRRLAQRGNTNSPRVYYLLGMNSLHAPSILGGKREGLKFLLRAATLFEAEQKQKKSPLDPVWGYDHCLTFIARTYAEQGDITKAEVYYHKALNINPMNTLAKENLKLCPKKHGNM